MLTVIRNCFFKDAVNYPREQAFKINSKLYYEGYYVGRDNGVDKPWLTGNIIARICVIGTTTALADSINNPEEFAALYAKLEVGRLLKENRQRRREAYLDHVEKAETARREQYNQHFLDKYDK